MSKRAVVSLATKNSRYVDGLARLSNSLRDNADGIDFLGFIHEAAVGSPLHADNNYAFKVYAIQKAIDAGYTQILWLDCSVYAVAPVQPIFDLIEAQGYWFEGAGCWLNDWCNDETLSFYEIDSNSQVPMIQSGFMGFNFDSYLGKLLFTNLKLAESAGLFNGSWDNHRHDQSCMSAIIHNYGERFSHQPEYVQYAGIYDQILNEKIIFKCMGL
ncbi:hypothetical protein [Mucilaginibacter xinganensis]|uniref:Uncharacterized protein n=1 Tax=Mucilaginibacter xinganensis TaxID=1234841 RepID=A0A223NX85_9SPHI|nr:hypothetical protein [Mucilaginibacter xinganensis]ASU34400.1 hypothetical protein MuYL_2513 [Mucilaginibacter xinganensis]